MKRFGVIYKITNTINGKIYIGQTIKKNPNQRTRAHFDAPPNGGRDLVYSASQKYGKEAFTIEVIASAFDRDGLNYLEKFFISTLGSKVPNGYNIADGGSSTMTKETAQRISLSKKGKPSTGRTAKGVPKSLAHCNAMSRARKGLKQTEARERVRAIAVADLEKPIIAIHCTTGGITEFKSISEASAIFKVAASNISRVCNKKHNRKQAGGYIWKFKKAGI